MASKHYRAAETAKPIVIKRHVRPLRLDEKGVKGRFVETGESRGPRPRPPRVEARKLSWQDLKEGIRNR